MALGTNFPVSPYYRESILDARTISRSGTWWTAVLVIADPRSKDPFVVVYRWQKRGDDWKVASKLKINSASALERVQSALDELKKYLDSES